MSYYRRNVFTGKLEHADADDARAAFAELNARSREAAGADDYRFSARHPRHHISRAMSIPPEQATPERIARENETARAMGTGAEYAPDGTCHLAGRSSRAREMRRRGYQDNDAGYGDYAGR